MNFALCGLLVLLDLLELASLGFSTAGYSACKQFFELEGICKPRRHLNLMCFNHTTKKSKTKVRPKGYLKVPFGKENLFFKLYQTKRSWFKALERCRVDGGSLAKIDSSRKQRVIQRIDGLNGGPWIGLRDTHDNDTFFWSDGSPLLYTKWSFFEPSHMSNHGSKEDCVKLLKGVFDYPWNDIRCEHKHPFLCEL
ncbi:C-type lectin BML-2-like [Haliotis cracherodii]|uniref:C-type lectin BML-2-like n=1 Tax=Haliotis cracherodii TaxID=6455 RepID=UPI0039EBBABE